LAVELLDPAEGERVLDACACPGGKSFSAAMRMRNRGSVTCFDLHANKLSLILSGAERLGLSILDVREQDGTVFDSSLERSFDRVLCDVPCSGLGVLSKKPDIRYKREDEIQRLPAIQRAILSVNARYVRPGGTLLYSTCTLHRKENEENIIDFLSEHPDFEPVPIEIPRKGIRKEDGMLTLFPDDFPGLDGFFVAKMRRIR
ncbi:MAG: methyltransferase domain-containing protein, partial [Candidatus Methanomethylophilaceae archaeon]|nr:methyltransferase domain-containing protein [Candidatus Methanomethylophilaceae archaeon]